MGFWAQVRRKIKRYLLSYTRVILMVKTWMFSLAALFLGIFFIYPQLIEHQKLFDVSISSDIFNEAQSLKITNIRFYGVDDKNTPYTITAKNAEEKKIGSNLIDLENPMADLITGNGEAINVIANAGVIDQNTEIVKLLNTVQIFSSQGYEVQTQELNFDMKTNDIENDTEINAKGEFGNLHAQGIKILNSGDVIIFKGKTNINLFER